MNVNTTIRIPLKRGEGPSAELTRLRAENERLRAALEEITGLRKSYMKCRDAHDAVRIAEAALAGKEQV